jgi:TonB family protein
LAECNAVRARHSMNQPAEVLSAPEPEYTISAWQAEVEGTVALSVLVGVDGRPYDVKVQTPLGWGLDERTVAAVKKWRFAPALKNGKPIPSRMYIDVPLRLTCFSMGSIRTRTCEPSPTAGSTVDSDLAKRSRSAP